MFVEPQTRPANRHLNAALAIVLVLLALAIRVGSLGSNSLSEDESAKWLAIQEYHQGHFAGVNSEHPMMLKMLAWGSLEIGERWNRLASRHGWPMTAPEGWLRLPNAIIGAATAGVLYLLCRLAMGTAGSFAAGLFWAISPLPLAINRLVKEETALTFFTLLGCYFYWRAKKAETDGTTRRCLDFSACAFGLAVASQYVIHLFGLNQLAWYIAGRRGLDHKPLRSHFRMLLLMSLVFLLANPCILSPASLSSILHWLHHDGVRHTGYAFDGNLYVNFPSLLLAGMPWYFYLWMLVVKTPIPILVAMIAGGILLLRDRKTVASCIFLSFGVVQLVGLSLSGAKWLRYSLPLLPFLYLAAGYAVHAAYGWVKERKAASLAGLGAVVLLGWPLMELRAWAPYYPLYVNAIGGGTTKIAQYFAPDEISEFDTREVAQQICLGAPLGVRLATSRPKSMTYYLRSCNRPDIQIMPLYDALYTPQEGDLIVLEPSRRFLETQGLFDLLGNSRMPRREVQVGPVSASTIYLFEPSALSRKDTQKPGFVQARPRGRCAAPVDNPDNTTAHAIWQAALRQQP